MLNCSDETAADIDKEVMMILKEAYEEAKTMLQENRDALDAIAAFLIEKGDHHRQGIYEDFAGD